MRHLGLVTHIDPALIEDSPPLIRETLRIGERAPIYPKQSRVLVIYNVTLSRLIHGASPVLLVRRIPRPVTRDRARIDAKIGPRDHAGVVRREKYRRTSVIARVRQFLHRHAFAKWFECIFQLIATTDLAAPSRGALERLGGIGRRRREAVDADTVRDEFHRRRSREVQQTALAGAVRDVVRLALMARGRDVIDDGAFASLLDHRLRNMLGEQERTAENYLELAPPFVKRHVDHAFLVEDDGVVYEDIDSAEVLARRRDRSNHLALVGDVASHRGGASAGAFNVACAVSRIFSARIDAYERGAFGRETFRDTAADIRAGPRDQRHFSI